MSRREISLQCISRPSIRIGAIEAERVAIDSIYVHCSLCARSEIAFIIILFNVSNVPSAVLARSDSHSRCKGQRSQHLETDPQLSACSRGLGRA